MSAAGPMLRRMAVIALLTLHLASCASPPLTLYTLGPVASRRTDWPDAGALRPEPIVIALTRVTLPDYLDSQDILVRRGSVLDSSHTGRWASRFSLGATEFLAARLSRVRPGALVTDQPQTSTPNYRLVVNISRLDIAAGTGTLEADWLIVPREPERRTRRSRVRLSADGSVASDQAVVSMATMLLSRLAEAIDIAGIQ